MYSDTHRQVELLLAAGADLNALDGSGDPPAIRAIATRADYRLVWEFLQRGADYRIKTRQGKNALVDAIEGRMMNPDDDAYLWREKIIEFLRSKGIEAHRPPRERPRGSPP